MGTVTTHLRTFTSAMATLIGSFIQLFQTILGLFAKLFGDIIGLFTGIIGFFFGLGQAFVTFILQNVLLLLLVGGGYAGWIYIQQQNANACWQGPGQEGHIISLFDDTQGWKTQAKALYCTCINGRLMISGQRENARFLNLTAK